MLSSAFWITLDSRTCISGLLPVLSRLTLHSPPGQSYISLGSSCHWSWCSRSSGPAFCQQSFAVQKGSPKSSRSTKIWLQFTPNQKTSNIGSLHEMEIFDKYYICIPSFRLCGSITCLWGSCVSSFLVWHEHIFHYNFSIFYWSNSKHASFFFFIKHASIIWLSEPSEVFVLGMEIFTEDYLKIFDSNKRIL